MCDSERSRFLRALNEALVARRFCSFCEKEEKEGVRLIEGKRALICRECVELMGEV